MIRCPRCADYVHQVFYADGLERWRCMKCEAIFAEPKWTLKNDELIRMRKEEARR